MDAVIIVSGTTGANEARLNGLLVASSATAWTAMDPGEIYIGINFALGKNYSGIIRGFYAWPFALSPIQADDHALSMGVIPWKI